MDINITGPSYEHYSQNTNFQRCVNMYPVEVGPEGRGFTTLVPRYGKFLSATLTDVQSIRGMITFNDVLYVVGGNTFYRVIIDQATRLGTVSSLGTISDVSGPVYMAANTNQIIIVNGSTSGWIYSPLTFVSITAGTIGGTASDTYSLTINGTAIYTNLNVTTALSLATLINTINTFTTTTGVTASSGGTGIINLTNDDNSPITVTESGTGFTAGTDGLTVSGQALSTGTANAFTQITDADFRGGSSVVFLDGYFFIAEPDSNLFYASALNNGMVYNGLDFSTASITQANIVALAVKNRELWIFKKDATEVWYDAANPTGMPLSPRVGSELSIGCSAARSVVTIDNTLYWFDSRSYVSGAVTSDQIVNQTTGNTVETKSTDALNAAFARYDTFEDAIAIGFQERGHLMYQITFPTEGKTWVYDLTTKLWHEREFLNSTFNSPTIDLAEVNVSLFGLNIVAGHESGKIYISDIDYYNDNGEPIRAVKTTQPFNKEFKLISINKLELRCNSGQGTLTDTDLNPYVIMRYSNDGGHLWGNELPRSLGAIGEYGKRIIWNRLGTAAEWEFEFSVIAPIDWAIISASVDVEIEE